MRIHSTTLSTQDLYTAATRAGVGLEFTTHGSRVRPQAHEIKLTGSGRTGGAWGNSGKHGAAATKAATWDEWGVFLEALFTADATVTVPRVYPDHAAFRWVTGNRYDTLTVETQHLRHRWSAQVDRAVTGAYYVHTCDCGAVLRRAPYGYTLEDLARTGVLA